MEWFIPSVAIVTIDFLMVATLPFLFLNRYCDWEDR